jgi:hypothetical protein
MVEEGMKEESGGHKLTPEQIKNWRDVLAGMIGPYAFMIPNEEIQQLRNKFQEEIKKERKT